MRLIGFICAAAITGMVPAASAGSVQVVVAKQDLPAYTIMKEDLVDIATMSDKDMYQNSFVVASRADLAHIKGLITAVAIPKGAQIRLSSMLKPSDIQANPGAYREPARRKYLEGMKYFNKGDYKTALDTLWLAKMLDPSNPKIQSAYDQAKRMVSGG
jgi:hypothetical protein